MRFDLLDNGPALVRSLMQNDDFKVEALKETGDHFSSPFIVAMHQKYTTRLRQSASILSDVAHNLTTHFFQIAQVFG
ncbi:hypothetical protein FQZ97_1114230 [compost metagenome]